MCRAQCEMLEQRSKPSNKNNLMTSDAEDVGNEHLPTLLVAQSDGATAVSVESPRDQVSPQLQGYSRKMKAYVHKRLVMKAHHPQHYSPPTSSPKWQQSSCSTDGQIVKCGLSTWRGAACHHR